LMRALSFAWLFLRRIFNVRRLSPRPIGVELARRALAVNAS
jgi:hypothetical protein